MAHFSLIRPLGWDFLSAFASAEAQTMDEMLEKCLNADEGGSWAPSAPIIIGGSGINTTGLLNVDGTLDVDGAADFGAATTFSGGTWPLVNSRSVAVSSVPRVLGSTSLNGISGAASTADARGAIMQNTGGDDIPAVFVSGSTVTGRSSFLEIPGIFGKNGNALVSLIIRCKGFLGNGSGTLTLPKYRVWKSTAFAGVKTALSSLVTDGHTSPNWNTTEVSTTITLTSPETIDTSATEYFLEVTHPFNADEAASCYFPRLTANYTVTSIRGG